MRSILLTVIKGEIEKLQKSPYISFDHYFTEYVIEMQDMNIEDELRYICKNNLLDDGSVLRFSATIQKELDRIDKCS